MPLCQSGLEQEDIDLLQYRRQCKPSTRSLADSEAFQKVI